MQFNAVPELFAQLAELEQPHFRNPVPRISNYLKRKHFVGPCRLYFPKSTTYLIFSFDPSFSGPFCGGAYDSDSETFWSNTAQFFACNNVIIAKSFDKMQFIIQFRFKSVNLGYIYSVHNMWVPRFFKIFMICTRILRKH